VAQRRGVGGVAAAGAIVRLRADLDLVAARVLDGGDTVGPAAQIAGRLARLHAEAVATEAGAIVEADFVINRLHGRRARAGTRGRRLGLIANVDGDLAAIGSANGEAEGDARI